MIPLTYGHWDASHHPDDDLSLTMPTSQRSQAEVGGHEGPVIGTFNARCDDVPGAIVVVVVDLRGK